MDISLSPWGLGRDGNWPGESALPEAHEFLSMRKSAHLRNLPWRDLHSPVNAKTQRRVSRGKVCGLLQFYRTKPLRMRCVTPYRSHAVDLPGPTACEPPGSHPNIGAKPYRSWRAQRKQARPPEAALPTLRSATRARSLRLTQGGSAHPLR